MAWAVAIAMAAVTVVVVIVVAVVVVVVVVVAAVAVAVVVVIVVVVVVAGGAVVTAVPVGTPRVVGCAGGTAKYRRDLCVAIWPYAMPRLPSGWRRFYPWKTSGRWASLLLPCSGCWIHSRRSSGTGPHFGQPGALLP